MLNIKEKVILSKNVVLQEFKDEKWLFNIEDGSSFRLNKESYMILKECQDNYTNIEDIYFKLGGNENSLYKKEEIDQILLFVDLAFKKNLLLKEKE